MEVWENYAGRNRSAWEHQPEGEVFSLSFRVSVCQYTCVSITLLVYIYIYIYNFIITLLSNEVTQMKKLFSRTRTRTRTITARAKSSLL